MREGVLAIRAEPEVFPHHGGDRIDSETVYVIFAYPVEGVLDKELTDFGIADVDFFPKSTSAIPRKQNFG